MGTIAYKYIVEDSHTLIKTTKDGEKVKVVTGEIVEIEEALVDKGRLFLAGFRRVGEDGEAQKEGNDVVTEENEAKAKKEAEKAAKAKKEAEKETEGNKVPEIKVPGTEDKKEEEDKKEADKEEAEKNKTEEKGVEVPEIVVPQVETEVKKDGDSAINIKVK